MEDIYVRMIVSERERLGVSAKLLCEGICTEDMYYKVENGKSTLDRISIKRLLARLGVDNANYDHYLEYSDYVVWKKRMDIINSIEDGEYDKALDMLNTYHNYMIEIKNKSRVNIEEQFYAFMYLQILRCSDRTEYELNAKSRYEKALKATVPYIDVKKLSNLVLSPMEMNLVVEYIYWSCKNDGLDNICQQYIECLEYIENASFGKLSKIKVYPKTVVYMYRAIIDRICLTDINDVYAFCNKIWSYIDVAFNLLKQRKSLLYMMEVLEIRAELSSRIEELCVDINKIEFWRKIKNESHLYMNTLKEIYDIYGIHPYMTNDCYLYRESGIYCVNEIIKTRREMLNKTQEELCNKDISISTIRRIETSSKGIYKSKLINVLEQLSLYPSCINMGIVTDKKEILSLYEELRYANISFRFEEVECLISELKKHINMDNDINRQNITGIECLNDWRMGKITSEQYIEKLKDALEVTIKLDAIYNKDNIFLSTEELTLLCSISIAYKKLIDYDEARKYISPIEKYMATIEQNRLVDGRIGIYEMVMEYIGSLYGDIGMYDKSNDISHKLIKLSLKLKRSGQIHPNIYNIAWNNNESKKDAFDYNEGLNKCIIFSQLTGDIADIDFYRRKIIE